MSKIKKGISAITVDNRENNKWTVYIHTSPSGKYYVGITSQKPKDRWNKGSGYNGQIFNRAINKYGWDNISHEIIASRLTESEAKYFEVALIRELKSNKSQFGYNATMGGQGTTGFIPSEETKKKQSEAKQGLYDGSNNPNYGKYGIDSPNYGKCLS